MKPKLGGTSNKTAPALTRLHRQRNLALGATLGGFSLLLYFISMIKILS